jgi:cyanophycin synthetase
VLNAADPIVADMAETCPGKVIFFAADRHHPLMATHRAQGKRTVYVDGGMLVAAEGAWVERIDAAGRARHPRRHHRLPGRERHGRRGRRLGRRPQLGHHPRGLASFVNDAHNAPGRFNVMDYKGATVIADYGHNPDAMRALVAAVDAMPATRPARSVVISGAGDRRDSDIRDQTIILGKRLRRRACSTRTSAQRGRADGEVVALLREGLKAHKARRTKQIDEIRGEFLAIDTALSRLQPGDLCLILVDQVQEALDHLAARVKEAKEKHPRAPTRGGTTAWCPAIGKAISSRARPTSPR